MSIIKFQCAFPILYSLVFDIDEGDMVKTVFQLVGGSRRINFVLCGFGMTLLSGKFWIQSEITKRDTKNVIFLLIPGVYFRCKMTDHKRNKPYFILWVNSQQYSTIIKKIEFWENYSKTNFNGQLKN